MFRLAFFWFALLASIAAIGQTAAPAPKTTPSPAVNFDPYTTCKFSDGLEIVDVSSMSAGVTGREVQVTQGVRRVDFVAGERVMFAYPGTHFYANMKVERLPAENYAQLKQYLIDNFDYVLASSQDNSRNYSLKPKMNDFEIYGLDRGGLTGSVIGMYLLFDNDRHDAVTIYFLNQEPNARKFQSIEEYRTLRDRFLATYTASIRSNEKSK